MCSWSQYSNQIGYKKFHPVYKNLNDQARSGKPKTVDSEALLQTMEANPVGNTRRVSGEFSISLSSVVHHLHNLSKSISSSRIVFHFRKILQNFWLTLVILACKKGQQKVKWFHHKTLLRKKSTFHGRFIWFKSGLNTSKTN